MPAFLAPRLAPLALACLLAGPGAAPAFAQAPVPMNSSPVPSALAATRAGQHARAEAMLAPWVAAHPEDEEARFLLARVKAWAGRPAEAIPALMALVTKAPTNAEYRAALGRALYWSGNPSAALPHLDLAREQAPQDPEVWLVELQVLRALGPNHAAHEYSLRQLAMARFPAQAARFRPPAPPTPPPLPRPSPTPVQPPVPGSPWWPTRSGSADYPRIEALVEGEAAFLTGGRSPWYEGVEGAMYGWTRQLHAWARLREAYRFDRLDVEAQLGSAFPLAFGLDGVVEATACPTGQFLPFGSASFHLNKGLPLWDITVQAKLKHAVYANAQVPSMMVGVDKYIGPFRLGASAVAAVAPDANVPITLAGSTAWNPTEDHGLTLFGSYGEEAEAIGPRQVLRYTVTSVGAVGLWRLPGGWALHPEVGWIRQGTFFDRTRVRLGVRKLF